MCLRRALCARCHASRWSETTASLRAKRAWSSLGVSGSTARTLVPTSIPLLTPTPDPTPTMFSVTVSVTPSGFGTVALTPPGGSYAAGTTVILTAVPAPGYRFDGWDGDASGVSPTFPVDQGWAAAHSMVS